ncbi:hypothetical protein GGR57DRAFT_507424 [Xylariaceae sp. FL1272]|nr:hypothetical protein GGR57DRAFT_507424 [Xylariaceae sp. FL1272]
MNVFLNFWWPAVAVLWLWDTASYYYAERFYLEDEYPDLNHHYHHNDQDSMEPSSHSALLELWDKATPFEPAVAKENQFIVAFLLLVIGAALTGAFAFNRTFVNIFLIGIPASTAIAFGTVYMFCAVGVYV